MLKSSSFQELLCASPCLGGQIEQVGVDSPKPQHCVSVWGGPSEEQQGQSCSGRWIFVFSNWAESESTRLRSGGVSSQRSLGGSVALLPPSHLLYCCAIEELTS